MQIIICIILREGLIRDAEQRYRSRSQSVSCIGCQNIGYERIEDYFSGLVGGEVIKVGRSAVSSSKPSSSASYIYRRNRG